jgi:hydroxyacylglutathione hydrolase
MLFKTVPTSQITSNIYTVRTKYVNFYIYKEDEFTICIDTGLGVSKIRKELQTIQISPDDVTHIFLTHSDKDHVKGVKLFSNAKVYISKLEEPLISGKIKRSPLVSNSKLERNYEILSDGEIITIGPIKVRAISTPGHTIGSMSYLINDYFLFVGDTIDIKKDKATTGYDFINMNTAIQKESIIKLSKLKNISFICTGHTGISKNFDLVMNEWKS